MLALVFLIFAIGVRGPQQRGIWPACLVLGALLPWIADASPSWMTRAAQRIATYSFGIYLFHVVAIWIGIVWGRALPLWAQFPIIAIAVVGLSVAGYHGIESPGIALGRRLTGRTAQRRSLDAAVAPTP